MKKNQILLLTTLGTATLFATYVPIIYSEIATAKEHSDSLAPSSPDTLSEAFEWVADTIQASVVSIRSIKKVRPRHSRRRQPNSFQDSSINAIFSEAFNQQNRQPRVPRREFFQQGQGSGFIVSSDGYILTNNHVVDSADAVHVTLSNDTTYEAIVIGVDPQTDLAVIKINLDNLTPLELGDSETLRVGEWVVAAGNPFGLSSTITAGIVSAKGRSRMGINDYEDFIQTDAAINPGNSGGPLVNLHGQVVGVNTAIVSHNGSNTGIGLAIPVSMAKSIMEDLIEDGRVVRGWLGVSIQNVTDKLAKTLQFDGDEGVVVGFVQANSPAFKIGLQPGDIIMQLNGKSVEDIESFRMHIAQIAPGTTATLAIFRDGNTSDLFVRIGELNRAQ